MAAEKDTSKQPEPTGMEAFATFLWNPQTKTCLGRTGISWLKITVFYIIFYICLAAFWALMLSVFYKTIDFDIPKWQLDASRIGSNPGLGYRPRPPDSNIDSTLIKFKAGEEATWQHWVKNLEEFVKPYQSSNDTNNARATASECTGSEPPADKYCPFDVNSALTGECTVENSFGYKSGKPCVLIKLNRIFNWVPKPLATNPEKLTLQSGNLQDGVAISCSGLNLKGVKYYPNQIIKKVYFPFKNQPGYLSPFIMVQFELDQSGILAPIECIAHAENVKYDRAEREGSVQFELLLD